MPSPSEAATRASVSRRPRGVGSVPAADASIDASARPCVAVRSCGVSRAPASATVLRPHLHAPCMPAPVTARRSVGTLPVPPLPPAIRAD
ncbi:hypothetical protein DIE21_17915 [Burkholderia sp. Bp9140]|nr:hypothetical protein DIE21_17915 [Burkholderia sp. Bp9140]